MNILITGAAGFIGFHLSVALLNNGHNIIGIDNINDYYDLRLKEARLKILEKYPKFRFFRGDISNSDFLKSFQNQTIDRVINLAAQAGVRYSIENPDAYIQSNIIGHLNILEFIRHHENKPLLVYASSSSVYGNTTEAPFKEDKLDYKPVSLYAATKIADEMMSYTYAKLYGLKQIGLRFFTVYGPYGRPDMAYWSFSDKILNNQPIQVFNNGKLRRDFTYIDDIVEGLKRIIETEDKLDTLEVPHKTYNIGNNKPVELMVFIKTLEDALGHKAVLEMLPMQMGDVYQTYADISELENDYGFRPSTSLETGINIFAKWFKEWSLTK